MKRVIAIVLSAVILTPLTSYAKTEYDSLENKVIVSHDKSEYINVMIVKDEDSYGPPLYIRQFLYDGAELELPLPQNADTGDYSVYVGENPQPELTFFYLNIERADLYVSEKVNRASTPEELAGYIIDGFETLHISLDRDQKGERICSIALQDLPFATYLDLKKSIRTAELMTALISAEQDEFEALLSGEQTFLGIDFEKYAKLGEEEKNQFYTIFCKLDWTDANIRDEYGSLIATAQCRAAEHYSNLKSAVERNAALLGITFGGKYDAISDKSRIYTEMLTDQNTWGSAGDVKYSFDSVVSRLYSEQKPPGSGGGPSSGGSGGGRSGGGSISYNGIPQQTDDAPEQAPVFKDLAGFDWAEEAIERLAAMEVINGVGQNCFEPAADVSRAEFAQMVYKAFNIPNASADFTDVSDGDWYKNAVCACAHAEIVFGYDGLFHPNVTISRQDAAVILFRIAEKYFPDVIAQSKETIFNDDDFIADYAKAAVRSLSSCGIITGFDGGFYPMQTASRAEAAVLIYRMLQSAEVTE